MRKLNFIAEIFRRDPDARLYGRFVVDGAHWAVRSIGRDRGKLDALQRSAEIDIRMVVAYSPLYVRSTKIPAGLGNEFGGDLHLIDEEEEAKWIAKKVGSLTSTTVDFGQLSPAQFFRLPEVRTIEPLSAPRVAPAPESEPFLVKHRENDAVVRNFITYREFLQLARDVAPKVNVFSKVWKLNPDAEFIGGTSRDFFHFLKRKLRTATNRAEAERIMADLRKLDVIDVREIVAYDSDIDIVSSRLPIDPKDFDIHKIDYINPSRFEPQSREGRDEHHQGSIAVEKIRLGRRGVVAWEGFGDGTHEIFANELSINFASPADFEKTEFARLKLNHPVLLALRWIRLRAMQYASEHGEGRPDPTELFRIDPRVEKEIRRVIQQAATPGALDAYLDNAKFLEWFNGTLWKAFRSNTNQTAAKMLLDHFGASRLVGLDPRIPTYNQYVFQRAPDPERWSRNITALKVDENRLFESRTTHFSDGFIYHGAESLDNLRSMIFQNVIPSGSGSAGKGMYGVNIENIDFAKTWKNSGDYVARLPVTDQARIVDITKGYGAEVYHHFAASRGLHSGAAETIQLFAKEFGIDVVKYPYGSDAYLVVNSAAVSRPEGAFLQLASYGMLEKMEKDVRTLDELKKFLATLRVNRINNDEAALLGAQLAARAPAMLEHIIDPDNLHALWLEMRPGMRQALSGPLESRYSQLAPRVTTRAELHQHLKTLIDIVGNPQHFLAAVYRSAEKLPPVDRASVIAAYTGLFEENGASYASPADLAEAAALLVPQSANDPRWERLHVDPATAVERVSGALMRNGFTEFVRQTKSGPLSHFLQEVALPYLVVQKLREYAKAHPGIDTDTTNAGSFRGALFDSSGTKILIHATEEELSKSGRTAYTTSIRPHDFGISPIQISVDDALFVANPDHALPADVFEKLVARKRQINGLIRDRVSRGYLTYIPVGVPDCGSAFAALRR